MTAVASRTAGTSAVALNLLVLVTDAFGGRGGIAKFNRDLLTALCLHPDVEQITAVPRVIAEETGALPSRLVYEVAAARGKSAYIYRLWRLLVRNRSCSAVICGHIHLLPLAAIAARRWRVPLILIIHGIEAWQPSRVPALNRYLRRVDAFTSASDFTRKRFLAWAPLGEKQGFVTPNCVDLSEFQPGLKPPYLLERYGLASGRVIMTLARLSAAERYKGIDEVLELMPSMIQEMPDLTYLIAGDGDDRPRFEAKAKVLGISQRVVFAGYVREEEKADHYRLADAFVMPGRGEGFGIVYLEAMACGIPVVASSADASGETVLDGQLGLVVDPDRPEEIRAAIKEALNRRRGLQNGLDHFSFEHFVERWHAVVDQTIAAVAPSPVLTPFYSSHRE